MPDRYDVIIRCAAVFDGTGTDEFVADVAVAGDRIASIGDLSGSIAETEIDGEGLALAPGFIDVHSHDDQALLATPQMTCKITQGVTTVIAGNCGISLPPLVKADPPSPLDSIGQNSTFQFSRFADYIAALENSHPALNAALMIGHMTLRCAVMSDTSRPATSDEIDRMREYVREALECGVVGLSTGLFYGPSSAAGPDEVIALLEELRGTGAVYTTHMRDESDGIKGSLDESFETARRAGVPLVISHHKCLGRKNFGRSAMTLASIDAAAKTQPVGLDAYPYAAGSTALIPEMIDASSRVLVSWSKPHPELAGRDLAAIAEGWGTSQVEAMHRLQPGGGIYFAMDEADVERILAYPGTMVGSDGIPKDHFPHPRLWGTFPRFIGHYSRSRGLFSMAEAIRRMTSLPAKRFGLADRGTIRVGNHADLVLFDPATIADAATFEEPTRPSVGIHLVVVNGIPVLRDGKPTDARPGRVIRRPPVHERPAFA